MNTLPEGPESYNRTTEAAVIGSMIMGPDCIGPLAAMVPPDAFYYPEHKILYRAIAETYARHGAFDMVLLQAELNRQGKMQDVGGVDYYVECADSVPSAANWEYYAKELLNQFGERQINDAIEQMQGAQSGPGDIGEKVRRIQEIASSIEIKVNRHRQINRQSLSTIEPKSAQWLWPEVLPAGMLTMLISQEGVGKSTLASYIAATISQGRPWPNGGNAPKGDVILFSHEEDAAIIIVPRLIANGADRNKIHLAESIETAGGGDDEFDLERDVVELDAWAEDLPETRLIIFDPITSYVNCNENSNSEVRKALKPLVDFAARRKISVLGLSHLNKKVDLGMINRTIGSRAWSAVPRMAWGVRTEQVEDDDGNKSDTQNRFLLNIKCNIARKPRGLKFSIGDGGCVVFHGERVDASMDDQGGLKTSRLNDAVAWLSDRLEDGPVLSSVLEDEGEGLGFNRSLLFRAKDTLKVRARKGQYDGKWSWRLQGEKTKVP